MNEPNKKYIILYTEKDSFTICHGIFDDFYKAVGKCACCINDKKDNWLQNDYKLVEQSDMWETECDNGFGWYRKYVNEEHNITIEEIWLVIEGAVEE